MDARAGPPWPPGDGGMAERIRRHDWSATPLGPISDWTPRLAVMVEQILASPLIATLVCGPARVLIYNDAAARLYGDRHPAALGRPLPETFPEGWATVAPHYARAFAGQTVRVEGQAPDTRGAGDPGADVFDALLVPVREADGRVAHVHMTGIAFGAQARAEAALRAGEAQYRALFDAIDEGFCVVEVLFEGARAVDYRFLTVNAAFAQQTGLTEAVGRRMRDLAPAHEARWFEIYGRIVLTGTPERFEDRAEALGRWYDVFAFRVGPPGLRRVGILFKDILRRKRAEAALRASEARFRAFVTASSDVVYRMSPDWSAMRQLDGRGFLPDTTAPDATWMDRYIHPDDRPRVRSAIDAAVREKRMFDLEHRVLRADGAPGWTRSRAVPILDEGGDILEWLGAASDVTAYREAAEALRTGEARLAAIFAALPVGIGVTDVRGVLALANERMHRFMPTGVMPSLDPDRRWRWRASHPDGRPLERDAFPGARALRGETVVPGQEMLYTEEDGTEIWTRVSTAPLRDTAGAITGHVSVITDIDALRRTADALRAGEERQSFLLALSDALRPLADPVAVQDAATRLLGRHLGVSRALYAEFTREAGREVVVVEREYRTPGTASFTGRHAVERFGSSVADLRAGRIVSVRETVGEAGTVWAGYGVRARLAVPLVKDGVLVAALVVHDAAPRAWDPAEIALARETAERTWDAVERAHAEATLRESEERLRGLVDGFGQFSWEARADGVIVTDSPGWRAFTGQRLEEWQGYGWTAAIHPDDRAEVERMWRAAVAQGCAVDTEYRLWHAPSASWRWSNVRVVPITRPDGTVRKWAGVNIDVTDRRTLQARQEVLVNELQHRARNLLGVVAAIADRTVKRGGSVEAFEERLQALSRAQGLLSQGGSDTVAVGDLVRAELAAYILVPSEHVGLDGPEVRLTARQVQNFALAVHELTTNAVKYGALSGGTGRLTVTWAVVPGRRGRRRLALSWCESGVAVAPGAGARRGYGTELIQEALAYALQAEVAYALEADGVRCRIAIPIA